MTMDMVAQLACHSCSQTFRKGDSAMKRISLVNLFSVFAMLALISLGPSVRADSVGLVALGGTYIYTLRNLGLSNSVSLTDLDTWNNVYNYYHRNSDNYYWAIHIENFDPVYYGPGSYSWYDNFTFSGWPATYSVQAVD